MQFAFVTRLQNATAPLARQGGVGIGLPAKDALAVAATYLAVVFLHHLRFHELSHLGDYVYWQDWSDQSKYVASARAFARGALDPDLHWYPLLYPLAISAFLWLPLFFAALIVNLACYGSTYLGFREVAARFGLSASRALMLFVATTLFGATLANTWIEPWTTTLSAALIWLSLGRLCRDFAPSERERAEPWPNFVSGMLLGLIPLCRPADAIVCAIIGAFQLHRILRSPNGPRAATALVGGGLAAFCAYAVPYLAIYGPHPTDYMKLSSAYGLNLRWLGWKCQLLLVEPRPFYPFGAGVLERFPWLALGAAGLVVAAFRPDRRLLALLVGAPAIAYALVMIAYVDLLPSGIWGFRNFHYFKWLMPLMGLFAHDFVWSFRQWKATSVAALGAVVAVSSFHYEAVAAAPDEPARLVTLAAPDKPFGGLYFENSVIADKGGRLRNMFEFHQIPDGRGRLYAEALRRDFLGGERWADSPDGVDWPKDEPGPDLRSPLLPTDRAPDRAPLGRYRPKLVLGWPCWLPLDACNLALPGQDD